MVNMTLCYELVDSGLVATADADIAGIGVIVAFTLSACLTLVAVFAAYFIGLVDAGLLGPVDRLVIRIPSRAERFPRTHVTLRKAILACSDQQIVTGIAILAAGFHGLRLGSISVYHFQIVIYLAWMSSSVHLSALTLLKPFMQQHRGVLVWRCVGMLVLLVMLLVALVPTVSNDWAVVGTPEDDEDATLMGIPAICFWGQLYDDDVNADAIISFAVLLISYVWKLGGLFNTGTSFWNRQIRNRIDFLLETPLTKLARWHDRKDSVIALVCCWLWLAVYVATTACLEMLDSFAAALWLSLLGLIYGMMQIIVPREVVQDRTPELSEAESHFGFGQLVPLILLIQPLGAITEHLWLKGKDDEVVYGEENPKEEESVIRYKARRNSLPPRKALSLLRYAAEYTVPPATETSLDRIRLKAILYTSRAFLVSIVWVNVALATVSGYVLYLNYDSAGYDKPESWQFVGFGVCGHVAAALLLALAFMPFSLLGRRRGRSYWEAAGVSRSSTMQTQVPSSDCIPEQKSMEAIESGTLRPHG